MRLELPQSAGGGGSTAVGRSVELDAFQSFAVALRPTDLTGLSVEASGPVFVSASLSSKLEMPWPRLEAGSSTPSLSNRSVQNEQLQAVSGSESGFGSESRWES